MNARTAFTRLLPLCAIFLSLILSMALVAFVGANPVQAYVDLFRGALADVFGFATTLVKATPLLFAGLGVAIALQAGLYNIGAEGQIYLGALATAFAGLYVHTWPLVHIPLALLAAVLGGGLWALLPALLKLWRGVNEIITTLLMNYIGILLVSVVVAGPLMERGAPSPYSRPLDHSAQLPIIIGSTLGLALALQFLLTRTPYGFQLRMTGTKPSVAAYAGVNVPRTLLLAMVVSGGLAGLAGASEVMGLKHRLFEEVSPGYGYDAIVIAFLGSGQPLSVIAMAFFFGALRSGADIMQRSAGIPVAIVFAIQGVAVLFLASSLAVQRRMMIGQRRAREAETAKVYANPEAG